MKTSGLNVDLHVHSKSSKRPSQWILQKLDCPESFTDPMKLYAIAKARGMDLVTITDHNTLSSSLEIAHLEDTFVSEEITAYFPENQCKLHVLALDITENQHAEISYLRRNVYDLIKYLNAEGIFHVVAHPLFDLNHKLTLEYFEKMLLLFENFELNGSRDAYQNGVLESILKNITKQDIDLLADKHGFLPYGKTPWQKRLTGGSDDHSSINIARMYTCVPGATTKKEFFEGLHNGKGNVQGRPASPKTMAHNLYGIAYQYYSSKFNLNRYAGKDIMFRFIHSALTVQNSEKGIFARLQDYLVTRKSYMHMFHFKTNSVTDIIQRKAQEIISGNPKFIRILRGAGQNLWEKEHDWFEFVNDSSEEVMKCFADNTLDSLSKAKLFNIFQTIGSAGSVYTILAPYFMAYKLFTKDRKFAELCQAEFSPKGNLKGKELKIALFTDTLNETNGVALTLKTQMKMAEKNNKNFSIVTCAPESCVDGAVNFVPIGTFALPEYPEIKLYYPPFLKILDYCYENGFTHIHASTPGPVGLAALAISKILDLPIYGTYHTAFPQYTVELTGDSDMEELMWKYMAWFYNQMDRVYVPSKATGDELIERGIQSSKVQQYPRGVDTMRFHPAKRNGFWHSKFKLPQDDMKLLYVGRISKEKNLDILARAFRQIEILSKNIQLIIVGDGPFREELQKSLPGHRAWFSGYLQGDDLAQAYASSDLLIFPSSTDTFGNVVLEAQASGIPAIVTDQGGPKENLLPDKTGFIVAARNPDAIVDAVMKLYHDPDRLVQMKSAARKYMEKRSFEAAFLTTWEMYLNNPVSMHPDHEENTPDVSQLKLAS
ncbi:MAG: glycosyltransferase [Desulfobacterales bacterium]|nr:glycosyltransferase [Desulfobacterales bacterium]